MQRETVDDIKKRVRQRREDGERALREAREKYHEYTEFLKTKTNVYVSEKEREDALKKLEDAKKAIHFDRCKRRAHAQKEARALQNGEHLEWIRLRRQRPTLSTRHHDDVSHIQRRLDDHRRTELDTSLKPWMEYIYLEKVDAITQDIEYAKETEKSIERLENASRDESRKEAYVHIDLTQDHSDTSDDDDDSM